MVYIFCKRKRPKVNKSLLSANFSDSFVTIVTVQKDRRTQMTQKSTNHHKLIL
jgi:hypothetical protein